MKKIQTTALAIFVMGFTLVGNATMISGNGLQNGLNAITSTPGGDPAGDFRDVNDPNSRHNPDEIWRLSSSGGSVMRMLFEFAGFHNTNSFGIYDTRNVNNRLELFSGADSSTSGPGGTPAIEVLWNLSPNNFQDTLSVWTMGALGASATFSSNKFGFYLDSSSRDGGGIFYSEQNKNADGLDHMITFAGDYSEAFDLGAGPSLFGPGEFILAWEDLDCSVTTCDNDYNDMVVLISNVHAVPNPATLLLFGLGLFGIGMVSRRRA